MTKTIKYLLIGIVFVFTTIILLMLYIKLDVCTMCNLTFNNDSYTLIVDKKIHKYLQKENINKCSIEINEENISTYLSYNDNNGEWYNYWVVNSYEIEINTQSLTVNAKFGTLSPFMYIYYLGI